ncbi:hypothetical protein ONZ45_g1449 [Pleurotus djamor]|nr:hypothetical protein ONZ45_g1449 [Pleurotus djamor]
MAAPPVEKDVSDQLLHQRRVRRKRGGIPYPLAYTTDMLNLRLTMHQFEHPPSNVLDLGCGGGYWAVEAARQWPNSTIIGYDLSDIQPKLSRLPSHHDLARRVKWVHGNLLDGLPFPSAHFDFIRIVGLGLGVPEDEWQFVLEVDIARIMKPGAVLEIIEEDLIFPCGRPPRPRLPPISIDSFAGHPIIPSPYSTHSSATLLSDPWLATQDDHHHFDGPIKKQSSLSTLHESPISISPRSPFSPQPSFTLPFPDELPPLDGAPHPQDHSRLKAAWEAMLSRRFLSSQLITVLPFYLSSEFVDIQSHPVLQIPLPPSSHSTLQNLRKSSLTRSSTSDSLMSTGDMIDPDHIFDLQPSKKRRSGDGVHSPSSPARSSQRSVPSWAPMHLAKTVNTIIGCKEAIWREYDELYRNDTSAPPVLKTVRKKQSLTSPDGVPSPHLEIVRPSAREGFELAWSNWESDMQDRIGMRGRIISECAWPEPDGTAADIVHGVVKKLIDLCVEGAKVIDICVEGDKLLEEGTGAVYNKAVKGVKVPKGIAFPTSISVNNCVAHFSPLASDPLSSQALAKDDVVKIHVGAHIDGFAAVSAETIVVGASPENPVTGRRADAIKAAWHAAEIAMRTIKVGNKNWAVTEAVGKIAAAWDCKPVEGELSFCGNLGSMANITRVRKGMLSCQQTQNVIDGKKRIILNPSETQRREFETITFAENEVYGMDILISTGEDGKARMEESRTSIFQRDSTVKYQLKMKTSRAVFSEMQKKSGDFPFNIRCLEDEKRSRMGIQEAVQHSLIKPYEVIYTPNNTFVAAFHFTIALLPAGPSLITHPPVWYKSELVKTEKELEDEDAKALLARNLRPSKPKKKKTKAEGEGAEE